MVSVNALLSEPSDALVAVFGQLVGTVAYRAKQLSRAEMNLVTAQFAAQFAMLTITPDETKRYDGG